jgi:thiol:disulfide interchange protein DsbD
MRLLGIAALAAAALCGQKLDPIKWRLEPAAPSAPPGAAVSFKLTASLDENWHLYSLTTPAGGPIVTTIKLAGHPAIARYRVFQPRPVRALDPNFNIDTETFEKQVEFHLAVELAPSAPPGLLEVTANLRYQACTDKLCLPPRKKTASATLTIDPAAPAPSFALPAGYTEVPDGGAAPAPPAAPAAPDQDLGAFLLTAFGLGLAAIFTPCVFPMIPITVSFFSREEGGKANPLARAAVFCCGIVLLFTSLGLGVTALLGASGVKQIAANPWVNSFIALLFFAFGLSLLGAFELTLPSGLLTRLNAASNRGGYLGTLLMGLAFSLTAFACVGPFMGTLLAASVTGAAVRPALGMAAFASGLALPFFFLALFPGYLQRLPRAGGWMARVKIVLGFVVLAAMLKYVSNVDAVLQTNLLPRELFLAAWFVLFSLPGLYLLGFLRMEGVKPEDTLGAGRALTGALFLVFAVSLLPGMFGAKLADFLEPYVPFARNAVFGSGAPPAAGAAWIKNDYRAALDRARSENKRVLISFTGYACTNCHWMKANMFPRPEIAAALQDLVVVELYTDGMDPASEANQRMQEQRFGTVAIPHYVVVTAEDAVVRQFAGLTRNTAEFAAFLKSQPAGF